jgi:serine/threonine protein phosphatase PrpC
MNPAAPRYLSAATTHQGYVRGNNEDRVYTDDARGFFLVVDGMGGHEAGEQAAGIAVEMIRVRLERQTGTVEQRLREAITLANNAIFDAAQTKPEWKGMACVLTAAVIEDNVVTIGHVGDSRLYRIKRGRIEKITHDHSPVGEREDSGELTEAQAMQHPRRNEVYRDVGSEPRSPGDADFIEIRQIPFEPDGALLICSDGLSDAIPSNEILRIVEEHAGDRQATVRALVGAAIQVGKDNVSAVLVEGWRFAAPKRIRVTDQPVGETTDRLPPLPQMPMPPPPHRPTPWYLSGAACLFYGLIVGAGLLFAVERYLIEKPPTPVTQIVEVKASESIAAALEKASSGDTIYVAAGTYTGPLHLKNGVNLIARPEHEAVIDGAVTADNVRGVRFEGFHVRGPAGIRIQDSDVTLARGEISGAHEAGVTFSGVSTGSIAACSIHNNAGGGILVKDKSAPAIENNVIVSNGVGSGARPAPNTLRPGLSLQTSADPIVTGNSFALNGAEAMWLTEEDDEIVDKNYFNVVGKPDKRPKFRIVVLLETTHEPR